MAVVLRLTPAALLFVLGACSSSYLPDGGDDAGLDADAGGSSDAEAGAVDAGDAGGDGAAACPIATPDLGTSCSRAMALRGALVPAPFFDPLGPIGGAYLYAFAEPPPAMNYVAHISMDVSSQDTSRPLEGFPLTLSGRAFSAGEPEAALVEAGLVAVTLGDGVETMLALHDATGHLVAPRVDLGHGFDATTVASGCDGVMVSASARTGTCGAHFTGWRIGVDGSVLTTVGADVVDANGWQTVWRGDRWTLFVIPQCGTPAPPYLVDVTLDGALGSRRELPIPPFAAGHTYLLTPAPAPDAWALLDGDPAATTFSYSRFDPDTLVTVMLPTIVYSPTTWPDRGARAVREGRDTDGYLFLETHDTTDSRTVLLRVRADATVVQTTEIERSGFHPPLGFFRWLGDRYVVSLPGGTDVLNCVP